MYRGPNHHNDGRSDANNYHPAYTDYPPRSNSNEEYDNRSSGHFDGNASRMSRRVTSATMQMPSTRSMFAGGPMEPQLEPESAMAGVAVGTIYDSSDHSSHFAHPPLGAGSSLPGVPYRDLMQTYSRDDAMMQRGRPGAAAPRPRPTQRPYPQPGPPQAPTTPPVEPTAPQTRLGRRMLARKAERQPDFVTAKFADAPAPVDCTNLECIMCQAALEIPKTAVVLSCPNCDEVQPVANCRTLRIGSGQVG